jgi:hypothetical protein
MLKILRGGASDRTLGLFVTLMLVPCADKSEAPNTWGKSATCYLVHSNSSQSWSSAKGLDHQEGDHHGRNTDHKSKASGIDTLSKDLKEGTCGPHSIGTYDELRPFVHGERGRWRRSRGARTTG